MAKNDKQIEAMRKLGYSEFQIEEMLADDKAVDRGEHMEWDLSDEEHRKAMRYANVDEHKKAKSELKEKSAEHKKPLVMPDATGKVAKKNAPKLEIMDSIYAFLQGCDLEFDSLSIVEMPTQKKVEIEYKGESFTLALTGHRKKG